MWNILRIKVQIGTVLGAATDPNWYNSDKLPGTDCLNCPGAQWTGTNATLTEYVYNLTAFTNQANMMFRIVFHADQAVNMEGAIVDNLVIRENALSTDEFGVVNFSIYPNPSEGVFNIKTRTNDSFNISVYDVTGKHILEETNIVPNNNNYKLDIGGYASGIYLLNLSTEKSKITKKLILN